MTWYIDLRNALTGFFKDSDGQYSMGRIITLGAFIESVRVMERAPPEKIDVIFLAFLGAWGIIAMNNKWQEIRPKVAEAKAQAAPAIIKQDNAVNNVDAT